MKDVAVLTIDMQDEFLDADLTNPKERLIEKHRELYEFCQENNIPVINVKDQRSNKNPKEFTKYLNKVPTKRNLTKKTDGAFTNPKIHEQLQDWDKYQLIVTGYSAPHCVRTTAEMATLKDYDIFISGDLVAMNSNDPSELMVNFKDWAISNTNYFESFEEMKEYFEKN